VPTPFEVLRDEALACTACKLSISGRTQVVFGAGDPEADLVFVGEGPGAEEDRQGLPFVGRSGQLLDRLMREEIGVTRDACYIANVVKCRPPGNRDPESDEIDSCRPWLERQLELIDPKVVMTLGRFAAQLLLDTRTPIGKMRGKPFPFGSGILIPTWHPAFALRGGGQPVAEMRADFIRARQAIDPPGGDRAVGAPIPAVATINSIAPHGVDIPGSASPEGGPGTVLESVPQPGLFD